MGYLRMVYSWPSKKGVGSFLVLRENLPAGKKIKGAKQAASASPCCPQGWMEAARLGIPNQTTTSSDGSLKLAGMFPEF